jgi:hypothetical protein
MVLYETVNELARDAEKSQGRDTINNARQAVWTIWIHKYICGNKYFSLTGLTWPSISQDWLVII